MTRLRTVAFAMDPARTEGVLTPSLLDRLARSCTIVDPSPLRSFTEGQAIDVLRRTEILVTGWGCPAVGRDILETAPNLKLIAHAAGTVKGFLSPDVLAAGITVTHAAEANAIPVAEFTLAAILFANKQVFRFRDLYRQDRNRSRTFPLTAQPVGNYNRTIGIIGASRIGRRVIDFLEPFHFRVLLHDPYVDARGAAALGVESVSLDELMRLSDVVSIHAPALPSTQGMIARRHLALMRDGATLINTARGIIVDQDDLVAELGTGRIDAVIDVTEPEVLPPDSPLYDLPNVVLTPHIAGALGVEVRRLGDSALAELERYARGEPFAHPVTRADLERIA